MGRLAQTEGLTDIQQEILAAVADIEHFRHRQVIEIDRLDAHDSPTSRV